MSAQTRSPRYVHGALVLALLVSASGVRVAGQTTAVDQLILKAGNADDDAERLEKKRRCHDAAAQPQLSVATGCSKVWCDQSVAVTLA